MENKSHANKTTTPFWNFADLDQCGADMCQLHVHVYDCYESLVQHFLHSAGEVRVLSKAHQTQLGCWWCWSWWRGWQWWRLEGIFHQQFTSTYIAGSSFLPCFVCWKRATSNLIHSIKLLCVYFWCASIFDMIMNALLRIRRLAWKYPLWWNMIQYLLCNPLVFWCRKLRVHPLVAFALGCF